MNKTVVLILYILMFSAITSAKDLSGIIKGDNGEEKSPLPGATVLWNGTNTGTFSDKNGKFSIPRAGSSNVLIVRYVGHKSDTVVVPADQEFLEIILESNLKSDEIEVVANQPASIISHSNPINSESITLRGLQKAACCNLSESFQTNPSVDVSFSDAVTGAKQIKLLGLAGKYSQIMIEQIPNLRGIATPFGLEYIPGPWMESIQISKGAASVTKGYESMTGQINIEIKKPETGEPHFFNAYANQFGRFEGNFNSAIELSDKWSTMFLGSGSIFNNEVDHNNDLFVDKPRVKQLNLMNRWKYIGDVNESMTGVKVLYENRQGGQQGFDINNPGDLYGIDIETQRYEAFTKNGFFFNDIRNSTIGTILSVIHHNQNSLFGSNSYDATQNTFTANILFQSSIDHERPKDDCEDKEEEENCSDTDVEGPFHKYILGLTYIYDEYDEMFNNSLLYRRESVPGAFVEYTYSGIENLTVISGFRADFHNLFGTFLTPRFHIKYNPSEKTTVRASAGKGYRVSNIFPENTGVLASSREFIIEEDLDPEEAWNYGLNFSTDIELFDTDFKINAEYYRTDFINQVITDLEQSPGEVHFYNLRGDSYSNSFQVDVGFEPYYGFEILAAYRLNDVKMTINGDFIQKPLVSKHKAFLNLAYTTEDDDWNFDFTIEYNGKGRLPNTSSNPVEYQLGDEFPGYFILHSQITKKFEYFELYLGAENLTNYRQPQPILAYNEPFGSHFDSSIIWGPVLGRMIYLGARLSIDR